MDIFLNENIEFWEKAQANNVYNNETICCCIDLFNSTNFAAFSYVWELKNGEIAADTIFFVTAEKYNKNKDIINSFYSNMKDNNFLKVIDKKIIEYDDIIKNIYTILNNNVACVGIDKSCVDSFSKTCTDNGLILPVHEYGYGFMHMSPCLNKLQNYILNDKIKINNNPLLDLNFVNCEIICDVAGNRKIKTKIDFIHDVSGICALSNAAYLYDKHKNKG